MSGTCTILADGVLYESSWLHSRGDRSRKWGEVDTASCLREMAKGAVILCHFYTVTVVAIPDPEMVVLPDGLAPNGIEQFNYGELRVGKKSYRVDLSTVSYMAVRGWLELIDDPLGSITHKLSKRGLEQASRGKK
jgi:hypothetical protein